MCIRDRPKTVRDVRSFVGLVGYYKRFIQIFSDLVKPLTELTKKKCIIQMGKGTKYSFRHITRNFVYGTNFEIS